MDTGVEEGVGELPEESKREYTGVGESHGWRNKSGHGFGDASCEEVVGEGLMEQRECVQKSQRRLSARGVRVWLGRRGR